MVGNTMAAVFHILQVIVTVLVVQCQAETNEYSRLKRHVLNMTSALNKVPPNPSSEFWNRSTLYINVQFMDIIDIDQVKKILNCIIMVNIYWSYNDLKWNPEDFGGWTNVTIETDYVWVPRLLVVMGTQESLYLEVPEAVTVSSNGIVWFLNHQYLSFRCHVDFTNYPFDEQTCGFGFYPNNQPFPNMALDESVFHSSGLYDLAGEWVFVNHSSKMAISTMVRPFPRIEVTVKRKPVYYVIVLIFPMVLTSLLMPLVFVIPARSGEKMSYLVAVLTSTAIFITLISDVMPRGLSSIPYLAMLLMEVLLEGLCAILASLLVVNKYEQEQRINKSIRANQIRPQSSTLEQKEKVRDVNEGTISKQQISPPLRSRVTSRQLDTILLALFGIGQLVFLMSLLCLTNWLIYL